MLRSLSNYIRGGAAQPNATSMPSAELGSLVFGQLEPEHQEWFALEGQKHSRIELRDLPHYRFWRDNEVQRASDSSSSYDRFLRCTEPDESRRGQVLRQYVALRDDIRVHGVRDPLRIVATPDGRKVLLDGTRRACVAYALGLDAPCEQVELRHELCEIVANQDEFYGTRNAGRPYQSIYYKESELVPGRRTDIIERFRKLKIEDIRGRRVLDIGCNIAVNAMTAWHFGAASVTGMEFSPRIAASALRLSTILDARVRMVVQDLGQPIPAQERFDTVFCFSLYSHVGDKSMLERNIANVTGRTLYFEGHENATREAYEHIFRHFSSVELLGFNQDGIHSTAATRPFFRCVRN